LILTAKEFNCRPSSFLTGLSSLEAYALDVTAMYTIKYNEKKAEIEDGKNNNQMNNNKKSKYMGDARNWL